jgi:AraC-like DNA-binding protein
MPQEQDRPSTIAAYAFAIATALKQAGIDPQEVFDVCELPIPTVTDPMHRLSNDEISRLFAEAVKRTGDPAFGVVVGETLHPGNLHSLGYAMMSSTTLRDFCERLKNYYRIVSQNAIIHTQETGDEFTLITEAPAPNICWETHDAFSTLMIRFVRFIFDPEFCPNSIDLMRPDPGELRHRYEAYFRCPISYGCERIAFRFNSADMDQPLPGASNELSQMHDQTAMEYLKKLEKSDIVNRVRTIVVGELASHALTKQHVADRMHMSPRSLQMKLAARDTSFQDILDSTRKSLAIAYMEQSKTTITEAAYLLGFSEVSNFTRAFKRWTGKSPREFRRSLGIEH